MKLFNWMIFLFMCSISFAVTVSQSDWSGEAGITSPVLQWTDSYCTGMQIYEPAVTLELIYLEPVEHIIASVSGPLNIDFGDMDGDGDIDVVTACGSYMYLSLNNDGQGTSWSTIEIPGRKIIRVVDYNSDGYLDIITQVSPGIGCYVNIAGTGLEWQLEIKSTSLNGPTGCNAADMDGDGDMDLLASAGGYYNFSWWADCPNGSLVGVYNNINSLNTPKSIQGVDMDNDGDIDALGASRDGDKIIWCENENLPGELWPMHFVVVDFDYATFSYAEDIDGDGDYDVAGTSLFNDVIGWWENTDGFGLEWTEHILSNSFNGAWNLFVEDADGDGDKDIIGVAYFDSTLVLWENTGLNDQWIEHIIATGLDKPRSTRLADINGDGFNDPIVSTKLGDKVYWYSILEHPPSGWLESAILDTGSDVAWISFSADYLLTEGAAVSFQFRSSNNWEVMGEWSEEIMLPDTSLLEILQDSTRFLQYRVNLTTSEPFNTPVLNSISVTYEPYSSTNDFDSKELDEFRIEPYDNPCLNELSFCIQIPTSGIIEVSIFDLSGRSVHESSTFAEAGSHNFKLDSISSGYYFCLVKYGDSTITSPILVLH